MITEQTQKIKTYLEIWITLIPNIKKDSDLLEKERKIIESVQQKSTDYQKEFQNQLRELIEEVYIWASDYDRVSSRYYIFSEKYPWINIFYRNKEMTKIVLDSFLRLENRTNIKNRVIYLLEMIYDQLESEEEDDWRIDIESISDAEQIIKYCQNRLSSIFSKSEETQKLIIRLEKIEGIKDLELLARIFCARKVIARICEKVKGKQKNNLFSQVKNLTDYYGSSFPWDINVKESKKEDAWKRIDELKDDIENTTTEPIFDRLRWFSKQQPNEIKVMTLCHFILIDFLEDIVKLSYHIREKGEEDRGDDEDWKDDIRKIKDFKELQRVVEDYVFKQETVDSLKRIEEQIDKATKKYSERGYGIFEREKFIALEKDRNQIVKHCRNFLIENLNRMDDFPRENWIDEIEKQRTIEDLELLANKVVAQRTIAKLRDCVNLKDDQLSNCNWQKDIDGEKDFIKIINIYQETMVDILLKAGIPEKWAENTKVPGFAESEAATRSLITKKKQLQ